MQGTAISPEVMRQLKQLLWGPPGQAPLSWKQGFVFNRHPGLQFGLLQRQGGPCGVLAAVQALILAALYSPVRRQGRVWKQLRMVENDKSNKQCLLPGAGSLVTLERPLSRSLQRSQAIPGSARRSMQLLRLHVARRSHRYSPSRVTHTHGAPLTRRMPGISRCRRHLALPCYIRPAT